MKILLIITIAFFAGAGIKGQIQTNQLERVGDPPLHYKPGHKRTPPPPRFEVIEQWEMMNSRGFRACDVLHVRILGHEYFYFDGTRAEVVKHSPECSNPKCQKP